MIFLLAALVLLVAFLLMFAVRFSFGLNLEESGQVGDWFGIASAIISGAAFTGVIYALILQRRDLEVTQKEFEGQREQQERQNQQRIFFELLSMHRQIVDSLVYSKQTMGVELAGDGIRKVYDGGKFLSKEFEASGQNVFSWILRDLFRDFGKLWNERSDVSWQEAEECIRLFFVNEEGSELDQYYRSIKNILLFLEDCYDKDTLNEALLAYLSNEELKLIFYRSLVQPPSFTDLVKKYHLLRDLNLAEVSAYFMERLDSLKN